MRPQDQRTAQPGQPVVNLSWPGWPEAIHCRSKKMCRVVLPRRSFQLSRENSRAQLPAVKAAPRCSKMPQ